MPIVEYVRLHITVTGLSSGRSYTVIAPKVRTVDLHVDKPVSRGIHDDSWMYEPTELKLTAELLDDVQYVSDSATGAS